MIKLEGRTVLRTYKDENLVQCLYKENGTGKYYLNQTKRTPLKTIVTIAEYNDEELTDGKIVFRNEY